MKRPTAGKTQDDAVTTAAGSVLGSLFKPLELVWRAVPRSVQYFLIGAILLLVIYPLIAFAAVVYLLDYLPDRFRLPLQERALQSWGLERIYSTTSDLNRLNEAVDTSTSFNFFADEDQEYNQFVVPGQKVRLRAKNILVPTNPGRPECQGAVPPSPDTELGRFEFLIDDIGWSKPTDAGRSVGRHTATRGKLVRVLGLGQQEWDEIDKIRDNLSSLPLTIAYKPIPLSGEQNELFNRCFRYRVHAYLEVYKPALISSAAVSKAAK